MTRLTGQAESERTVQQFVIQSREKPGADGLAPIGRRQELIDTLSRFNTSPERDGGDVLWGPGIRIELPGDEEPVRQMLMTITEEEIAWMVIMRLARQLLWKIVDPTTGRELNP
ncbi:MAG: hypothetical protein ACYTG1_05230 [Planctomycetota bacterium]|jgi:hypothetical protein